ncbi:MAG: penicillin-binding transpeptidase domain-containing protein, partial [Thermocrispum sp.]
VHGKTGTAQFGDGTHAHGWFAGYRGDVAFAVLVVGGESSGPAVEVSKAFLSGL